jgi:hypothetical protein
MLILNPKQVTFGTVTWPDVVAVSIERRPHREAVEWSDAGPHVVLADVPEQRVELTVVQELSRDDLASPKPSEQAALAVLVSPTASDVGRRRVSATCVIVRVEHEVSARRGALRTIKLVAISSDGLADPITVVDQWGGGGIGVADR